MVYVCPYRDVIPAMSMTYYSGRLFCAGVGRLSVFDFSQTVVEDAQVKNNIQVILPVTGKHNIQVMLPVTGKHNIQVMLPVTG